MKKPYQITKRRAAEQFAEWAKSNEVPIQLTIPTPGIAELAQQSLGDLLRSVGKIFIESVMESEVEQLAGKRSERLVGRGAYRWGSEEGFCIIDGQRVPVDRPRVRSRQHDRCLECDRKDPRQASLDSTDSRYCITCDREHRIPPEH